MGKDVDRARAVYAAALDELKILKERRDLAREELAAMRAEYGAATKRLAIDGPATQEAVDAARGAYEKADQLLHGLELAVEDAERSSREAAEEYRAACDAATRAQEAKKDARLGDLVHTLQEHYINFALSLGEALELYNSIEQTSGTPRPGMSAFRHWRFAMFNDHGNVIRQIGLEEHHIGDSFEVRPARPLGA